MAVRDRIEEYLVASNRLDGVEIAHPWHATIIPQRVDRDNWTIQRTVLECHGIELTKELWMPIVSAVACETYEPSAVRRAVRGVLSPLGGIARFVQPGMQVLLKPNLLLRCDWKRAVTTHPTVVQAVAELVQEAGGTVLIGDSPGGAVQRTRAVWRSSGLLAVAVQIGACMVPFDGVTWKRLNGDDYFLARPALEADLVINLPKLKTHSLTLYTGAVKNLFGTIPGKRKREVHYRYPGVQDFSSALVDILELVPPGLTLMDGVLGQEGSGPGMGGSPRRYGCMTASEDSVALDTVIVHSLGYRPGDVLHLSEAGDRGLGETELSSVNVVGDRSALDFGQVTLPSPHWYFRAPKWAGAPLSRAARMKPRLVEANCLGCGNCVEACPTRTIAAGRPPQFDMDRCIGCLCCVETCPEGAIQVRRGLLDRFVSATVDRFSDSRTST